MAVEFSEIRPQIVPERANLVASSVSFAFGAPFLDEDTAHLSSAVVHICLCGGSHRSSTVVRVNGAIYEVTEEAGK